MNAQADTGGKGGGGQIAEARFYPRLHLGGIMARRDTSLRDP